MQPKTNTHKGWAAAVLAAVSSGYSTRVHFVLICVHLRSSDGPGGGGGGALPLPGPYLCQWVLNISDRLEIRFFPTGRLVSTAGAHRGLGLPRLRTPPPRLSSLTHPTPCESPPFASSPGLTEKDLPAKLEVFTISVTLTFRHVWSVSGAAVGVQWVGPETGKGEMRGCKWASREGGQLGMLCPKTDMNPP